MSAPGTGLAAVVGRISGLRGWRRWLASFALGLAAALALPPVGAFPILFICLPILIWQIDGARSWREAGVLGWWFGLGHFMAGTYWISNALLVEADRFAWLIPFTLIGVSAYLALYPAIACLFARLIRPGWPRVAAFALAWSGAEIIRGVAFTGFPWNPIGSVWVEVPAMIQPAALIGVFGLGLVTAALAGAPALIAAGRRQAWAVCIGVPVALALIWLSGSARLAGVETRYQDGITLGIVQPNIPQTEKVRSDLKARHFAKHLRMTANAAAGDGTPAITHFIWPETAVGFALSRTPGAADAIAKAVPTGGLVITGTLRATALGIRPFEVWNSLQAIDENARIVASYDKAHLVPFGEFVPLRSILGFLQVAGGRLDFSRGAGARTIELPGLPPASPLICYEIIFPGAVADPAARPAWLLNVTNDGWFGESAGPYQHLASARLRAVEEGLPVIRAANSGISAVIDPYGRLIDSLGVGREGIMAAKLPLPVAEATAFAGMGNTPIVVFIAIFASILAFCMRSGSPDLS